VQQSHQQIQQQQAQQIQLQQMQQQQMVQMQRLEAANVEPVPATSYAGDATTYGGVQPGAQVPPLPGRESMEVRSIPRLLQFEIFELYSHQNWGDCCGDDGTGMRHVICMICLCGPLGWRGPNRSTFG
jgi:hypothetical protein